MFIKCELVTETDMQRVSYGFNFFDNESGAQVHNVKDMFDNIEAAEDFCRRINENDVCIEHIRDIIDDEIAK